MADAVSVLRSRILCACVCVHALVQLKLPRFVRYGTVVVLQFNGYFTFIVDTAARLERRLNNATFNLGKNLEDQTARIMESLG
jgi:hypothetical protein